MSGACVPLSCSSRDTARSRAFGAQALEEVLDRIGVDARAGDHTLVFGVRCHLRAGLRAGELFAWTKDFVQAFAASGKIGQALAAIY